MPSEYEVGVILPPDIETVSVGIAGLQGPAGTGVPAGGAVNDIIYKSGTADYTTAWTAVPTLDGIQFDTTAGLTADTEGELVWDDDAGTIDLGLNGGAILKVGEDVLIRVQAAEAISKGQVCIAVGTVGNSGVILAAKAVPTYNATPIGSERIMGLAAANIAQGARGYVVAAGQVRKVNTLAFSEGDILWADPAVAGGLTVTRPAAGNWRTIVAFVVTDSATVGCLQVRVTPGSNLGNDELVDLTGQQSGDVLTFNGSVWVADSPAVVSVNGATGTVVLDASSVGAIGTAVGLYVLSYGTAAVPARPSAASVYWQGTTEPGTAVAQAGDLWYDSDAV